MRSTASRWQGFGTTIFTEMSALAERTGAINLGQGFPDEDGPAEVLEAAQRAIRDGHYQDAPLPGVPALREAIAAHQRRFYGLEYDPDPPLPPINWDPAFTDAVRPIWRGPLSEVLELHPHLIRSADEPSGTSDTHLDRRRI